MEQSIQLRKENIADDNALHFASIGGKQETALVIERIEHSSEVIRWARYWCSRLNPSVYAHLATYFNRDLHISILQALLYLGGANERR